MRVIPTGPSVVTSMEVVRQQRLDAQLKQLEFHSMLHRKLDLVDLLDCFFAEGQAFIGFDGVSFIAADRGEDLHAGERRRYRLEFELELGGKHLGDIRLLRRKPFDERDRREGARLVEALIYPIDNALAHHEATVERLTDRASGLQNQESLEMHLPRDIRHAMRIDEPLSVILLTVDYLESITEHHGSAAGEHAWHAVSTTVLSRLREHDSVYRTAHDEFLIVLPQTGTAGAEALAARLQKDIAQSVSFDNVQFVLSASVGLTDLDYSDDIDSLTDRAQQALAKARQGGRNQIATITAIEPVGGGGPSAA